VIVCDRQIMMMKVMMDVDLVIVVLMTLSGVDDLLCGDDLTFDKLVVVID